MLALRGLEQLTITDEPAFACIPLYAQLKQVLLDDHVQYRVMPPGPLARWEPALLLNLTYWQPGKQDDVLEEASVPADVVAHRAWHHLAHRGLGAAAATPAGLLWAEAIASAFDVYLIGRLLSDAPDARMLETQVPAMAEVAAEAGLDDDAIDGLMQRIARAPEVAFAQLRELLFDVGTGLWAASDVDQAADVLLRHDAHPYAPLLHHYELSSWMLYARAFGQPGEAARVAELDGQLRQVADPLAWLFEHLR